MRRYQVVGGNQLGVISQLLAELTLGGVFFYRPAKLHAARVFLLLATALSTVVGHFVGMNGHSGSSRV